MNNLNWSKVKNVLLASNWLYVLAGIAGQTAL
jgi:hypothetical protein